MASRFCRKKKNPIRLEQVVARRVSAAKLAMANGIFIISFGILTQIGKDFPLYSSFLNICCAFNSFCRSTFFKRRITLFSLASIRFRSLCRLKDHFCRPLVHVNRSKDRPVLVVTRIPVSGREGRRALRQGRIHSHLMSTG